MCLGAVHTLTLRLLVISQFSDKSALCVKARYILRFRACFPRPAAEPGQLPEQEDRHHRRRTEGKLTPLCLVKISDPDPHWFELPDPKTRIQIPMNNCFVILNSTDRYRYHTVWMG